MSQATILFSVAENGSMHILQTIRAVTPETAAFLTEWWSETDLPDWDTLRVGIYQAEVNINSYRDPPLW